MNKKVVKNERRKGIERKEQKEKSKKTEKKMGQKDDIEKERNLKKKIMVRNGMRGGIEFRLAGFEKCL